jgi:hypothetical protein
LSIIPTCTAFPNQSSESFISNLAFDSASSFAIGESRSVVVWRFLSEVIRFFKGKFSVPGLSRACGVKPCSDYSVEHMFVCWSRSIKEVAHTTERSSVLALSFIAIGFPLLLFLLFNARIRRDFSVYCVGHRHRCDERVWT